MTLKAGQRRVLVVDDNIEAAELLQTLLELENYVVCIAADGNAGLSQAASFMPQVVISDIRMPGMTGFELATALRLSDGGSDLLLIAVSGYLGSDAKKDVFDAGFDRCLLKPVIYDDISSMLSTHFEHTGMQN